MAEQDAPTQKTDEYIRADKHLATYANSVRFESSIWDLRLFFSQILKYGSPALFEERAEITVPWLQAKAMAIFMAFNVAAHEEQFGPITIPSALFGEALKKFGDRPITLEQIFLEVVKDRSEEQAKTTAKNKPGRHP